MWKRVLIWGSVGLFSLFVLGGVGLCRLVTLIESGRIPDTAVVPGSKMAPATREAISKVIALRPDEHIQFYYSPALFSHAAAGNLIADQRVISYEQFGDQLLISEADYAEIEDIDISYSDGWLNDSLLFITRQSGASLTLLLSTENGLDRIAANYILERIAKVEPPGTTRAAPPEAP